MRGKYYSALGDNTRLKEDERKLLTNLEIWEQKFEELKEKDNNVLEDMEKESKDNIAKHQSNCIKALKKVTKTLIAVTDVSTSSIASYVSI